MNPAFASSFRLLKLLRLLLAKDKLFTFLEQEISKNVLFFFSQEPTISGKQSNHRSQQQNDEWASSMHSFISKYFILSLVYLIIEILKI